MNNLNLSNYQDQENKNLNLFSKNSILEKQKAKHAKIRQAIKRAQEEIDKAMFANQSMLVDDIHQENYEDFEYHIKVNFKSILDYNYGDEVIEYLKEKRLIDYKLTTLNDEIYNDYEEEILQFINNETHLPYEIKEYYEAWLCDSWLLNKLEKHNQLIIDYKGYEQWWGRRCAGQKCSMDLVIQEITKELASEYACVPYHEIGEYLEQIKTPIFNLN